jgi:pimeloyl-ACP methyl ester carboxylesterase
MLTRTRLIQGLRIAYWHVRSGNDVALLVHGNSSSKEVFIEQVRALSREGISVVVPDLPGHGQSANARSPRKDYSFPNYARTLHRLMSQIGYSSYHIVGWSLGGHIGLEMLSRYEAVRSLLVTGTPPISLDPVGVSEGFRWNRTTSLAGKRDFDHVDRRRYLETMMGRRLREGHPLARSVARTDGDARFWMVRNGLAGIGADETEAVATSRRPFAIVQGRSDAFVDCNHLKRLRYANIWRGGPVFVEAGHAPHWMAPRVFNEKMMEFLRTVE